MATAPSYIERASDSPGKRPDRKPDGFFFQRMVTPSMLKMLYSVHLLIGLIAAVWCVFSGFQTSTSNGLLALILGVPAMLSMDRVLPHRRGIPGRRFPRRPGHHKFAKLSCESRFVQARAAVQVSWRRLQPVGFRKVGQNPTG